MRLRATTHISAHRKMSRYARKATLAASIDELTPQPGETVALIEIIHQRRAFAEMIDSWQEDATLPEIVRDAAKCAAIGCGAPMAKVLEIQTNNSELIVLGHFGLSDSTIGKSAGFVEPSNPAGRAIASARPVVDLDVRIRQKEKLPPILTEFGVVTSVNLPLLDRHGPYGILEIDFRDVHNVDAADMSFLASVASLLAECIENYKERSTLIAERDTKALLLREQQHRIRNNFQLIVSLLQQHSLRAPDVVTQKSFKDVERRVFAMASLFDHLLGLGEQSERVDIGMYLKTMTDAFPAFYGMQDANIDLEEEMDQGVFVSLDACTAVGTVVNELVANAVEHAFAGSPGLISISLNKIPPNKYRVRVLDNGCGFERGAHDRIGLRVSRRLIANLGGHLDFLWSPGGGTQCEFQLSITDRPCSHSSKD